MAKISKIALINSENELTINALKEAADNYDDEGLTVERDICWRVVRKIEASLEKNRNDNG